MKKQYWIGGGMALVLTSAIAILGPEDAPANVQQSGQPVTIHQAPLIRNATPNDPASPDQKMAAATAAAGQVNTAGLESADTDSAPPIPRPVKAEATASADPVQLWTLSGEDDESIVIDDIPATRIQVDPAHIEDFSVGQTLLLPTPNGEMIEADLTATHNDPQGVHVWQGEIPGARKETAVIVSRGEVQTHMIIASESSTYSVVIDNRTGAGTLVDEGAIKELQAPFDDGIVLGPPDEIPLPVIN